MRSAQALNAVLHPEKEHRVPAQTIQVILNLLSFCLDIAVERVLLRRTQGVGGVARQFHRWTPLVQHPEIGAQMSSATEF